MIDSIVGELYKNIQIRIDGEQNMYLKKIAKSLAATICMSMMIAVSAQAAPNQGETTATEAQVQEASMEETQDTAIDETEVQTEETQPETERKKRTKKETEESESETQETETQESEPETESEAQEAAQTNEELIEQQEIESLPKVEENFRFSQIEKTYAVAKKNKTLIREEMDRSSRPVGRVNKRGLLYVIQEEDNGWLYVESGEVRGFVKAKELILGKKAKTLVRRYDEEEMKQAKTLVEPLENSALLHTKTTVRKVAVKKKYAIAVAPEIPIRVSMEEDAQYAGMLQEGGLCYILKKVDKEWVYVESDVARGFVRREELLTGKMAREQVEANGEENYPLADILIQPSENEACYYTLTSIKEGAVESSIRSSMVNFALQFVGNPYVWGGTSLTNGADCSGFVQSIYAEYGYSIPRVAEDQAQYGTKIPVEDAQPGDLIFYARNGYIYHVVMCIGDGVDVEAQSSATGIVTSGINYNNAVWATRIITEEDEEVYANMKSRETQYTYLSTSGAQAGDLLGSFKLTAYCSCPICCGVWSGGPTASGAMPVEGRTVAMAGVPFGTQLVIGDQIYTVEDRGTPYGHVDIYMNSHEEACAFGVRYAAVYTVEE